MKIRVCHFKTAYELVRDSVRSFVAGGDIAYGAALSYYTFFSVAPLFVIALGVAGVVFGEQAARQELFAQLTQLVGPDGSAAIQSVVAAANQSSSGRWAHSLALVTLMVAATSVFVQLQDSLNRIWHVRQKPGRGWRNFLRHRLLSFAMVVGVGFLLLVSLVLSAGLAAFGSLIGGHVEKEILLKTMNFLLSLGIITALFAMIFKFLPDIQIRWRDVWLGGFLTALLFNVGKLLFGIYIGRSSIVSIYGAMGSLVVVLLWVYYSAQILFLGARFTRVYICRFGLKPKVVRGAEFV